MKLRLLTLKFLLLITINSWAYDFKIDGLCYNIISEDRVEVTYEENPTLLNSAYPSLNGDISVPTTINYEGLNYNITNIGDSAFRFCSRITSIILPNTTTNIGKSAFEGCSELTTITLPNSIGSIDDDAFKSCQSLISTYYTGDIADWCRIVFGSCDFIYFYYGCSDMDHSHHYANPLSNGSKLYINNQLVTNLIIPDEITRIYNDVFYGCTSLTSVTIPNSITNIGPFAFDNCSSLTSIYWNARKCNDFIYHSSSSLIRRSPFYACPINEIIFGETVKHIPSSFCQEMHQLTQITIPDNVTSIGEYVINNCNGLNSITIGDSITNITNQMFHNCPSLSSITIGNGVTEIDNSTFKNHSSLSSVNIGNGITKIGQHAFYNCSSLSSFTIHATIPPMIEDLTFGKVNKSIPIHVPSESLEIYKTAEYWKEFNNFKALTQNGELVLVNSEGGKILFNNVIMESGSILEIPCGSTIEIQILPDQGYCINNVTYEGTDYTEQVGNNGILALPINNETAILQVSFTQITEHAVSYYVEGSGVSFINMVNDRSDFTIRISKHDSFSIISITLNGINITDKFNEDGTFIINNITEDQTLIVTTNITSLQLSPAKQSRLRAWKANHTIFVEVDDTTAAVVFYDVSGKKMQEIRHNGNYQLLTLPALHEVNLIQIINKDGNTTVHKLI